MKHRNIANSEKIKSRKQYEINIAEKRKTDPKFFWKYVNTSMKVKNGISKLVLGNGPSRLCCPRLWLQTIAGKYTCGGSVAFPWEAHPKGGNYDGV